MKDKKIRLSKLEVLLSLSVILIIGIPFYLKIQDVLRDIRMRRYDDEVVTVVRVAGANTGALSLKKYNVVDYRHKSHPVPNVNLSNETLSQLKIQKVRFIDEEENLVEMSDLHPEPLYSFNKNILLITGKPSRMGHE
ncbi:MAG: hypothetical protein JXR78_07280 [Victivallales bacterium]|nr:hypothetical protein [Victivallales bacterium]